MHGICIRLSGQGDDPTSPPKSQVFKGRANSAYAIVHVGRGLSTKVITGNTVQVNIGKKNRLMTVIIGK